ncbi:hypothetical protein BLNAU_22656 [Blattamonas nauphoetae]|uniref:Uncharacterized protein n=1 Tax=Blattamonas nauphoetae TaxID=2049346 RepID=A0ABQ9WSW9_9EUKA|nr:hypothetical protein BLNAU_22656 [Blattamonas nauphoetae]
MERLLGADLPYPTIPSERKSTHVIPPTWNIWLWLCPIHPSDTSELVNELPQYRKPGSSSRQENTTPCRASEHMWGEAGKWRKCRGADIAMCFSSRSCCVCCPLLLLLLFHARLRRECPVETSESLGVCAQASQRPQLFSVSTMHDAVVSAVGKEKVSERGMGGGEKEHVPS